MLQNNYQEITMVVFNHQLYSSMGHQDLFQNPIKRGNQRTLYLIHPILDLLRFL